MAAEPIHVEVDDEVPAIVDRIRRSSADEIHLLLPARARFGQSRFNFQLLKQYAMRLGKRVAIVSSDPGVQRLAEESGFGSFRLAETSSAAQAPRPGARQAGVAGWRVPGVGPAGARTGLPSGAPSGLPGASEAGLGAVARGPGGPPPGGGRVAGIDRLGRPLPSAVPGARIRIGAPQRLPARLSALQPARYVLYAGAAALLLAGILATVFYVPSARVTLVAQAQSISTPVNVTAEPGKPPIHVRVATITKKASIQGQATGVKTSGGQLAVGQFAYVNACPFDLLLPRGQRLISVTGVRFAQLEEVQVHGTGGTADVSIKAEQPGTSGNVGAGQITTIDKNPYSNCLAGSNPAPTAGGTDDQKQTVIQTSDLQSARAKLEQDLRKPILDELTNGQQKGETLVNQPIFPVEDFTTTHSVDENYPNFTATLTLQAEGHYFVTDDVDRYFADQLKSKVPANLQLTSNQVKPTYSVSATAGGHLDFTGQATGYVAPKLDTDKVSGQLVGKTSSQAHDVLTKLPVRRVEIQQTPLPLPLLPFSSSRIYIDYVIDPAAAAPKPA
ncbi:MAG TPA: baseplate J/gp47 family protein [Candidatus Dormibacteraeota bacterium]|nr:baseplate J/gp47 family protein [Candidatus Dormibacteraeota bacterium]